MLFFICNLLFIHFVLYSHGERDACKNYTNIIKISTDYNISKECTHQNNTTYCNSFSKTLEERLNDSTCIVLYSDIYLYNVFNVSDRANVKITGSSGTTAYNIFCNSTVTHLQRGFFIYNSTGVIFTNLNFYHCGFQRTRPHIDEIFQVSQSVYAESVENLNVINTSFYSSRGYALTLHDVFGTITFSRIRVENSENVNFSTNSTNYTCVGGMFIDFSETFCVDNNTIIIDKDCAFVNNSMNTFPDLNDSHHPNLPYGNGGAVSIVVNGNTSSNQVFIDAYFERNSAVFGGAVFVRLRPHSRHNQFNFNGSVFQLNHASISGGAVYISQQGGPMNTFSFAFVNFTNNSAVQGGGLSYLFSTVDDDFNVPSIDDVHFASEIEIDSFGRLTHLDNCNFTGNRAYIGSSMHLRNILASISSVTMTNGDVLINDDGMIGNGGIYAQNTVLSFYGVNFVGKNRDTAVILDCSKIYLTSSLLFQENSGYNGGALALYGHSQIVLSQTSNLTFIRNRAENLGGALYADVPGPQVKTDVWSEFKLVNLYSCFLWYHDSIDGWFTNFTGSVTFSNNTRGVANNDLNDVYVATLQNCLQKNDSANPKEILTSWKNFNFSNSSRSILTRAVSIDVLAGDEVWNVYPGYLLKPHIVLKDERGQLIDGTIKIEFSDNVFMETYPSFAITFGRNISFSMLGNTSSEFDVNITSIDNILIYKAITNRTLKICSFGLKYDKERNRCVCDMINNLKKGIAMCDENQLYLFDNRWVYPDETDEKQTSIQTTHECPLGYCATSLSHDKYIVLDKRKQCSATRNQTSRLCSKCNHGLSVPMGSENCRTCPKNTDWIRISSITLTIIVGLSVLILLFVWWNIDVMSFYINPVLYSYQVMDILWPPGLKMSKVLQFVISIFEFTTKNTAYPAFCLWDGMNNLQKMAYNYIIPAWMFIFMMALFAWTRFRPNSRLTRDRCLRTFTIVGLMIFSDFTRISFWLLNPVSILDKKYLYIYAETVYFGDEHLPYAIAAVFLLFFFVIAIPLLILLSPCVNCHRFPRFAAQINFLQSVMCSYSRYLRTDCIGFVFFFYVSRLLIFVFGLFYPSDPVHYVILSCLCLLVFMAFAIVMPFKNQIHNFIEVLLLANLTIMAIVSLAVQTVYDSEYKKTFRCTVSVLSYVPMAVIFLAILIEISKQFRTRFRYRRLIAGSTQAPVPHRPIENYNAEEDEPEDSAYYAFTDTD